MGWHRKYWDVVDQFYWSPAHLGLVSINKKLWGDDPKFISLRRDSITNGSTLYTRSGTRNENATRMLALEETLNHIFDIAFAIAPDAVLAELFLGPVGMIESGPIDRIGREAQSRYGWGGANVTQQDMFLATPRSLVGVELKLGSPTSDVQVLKYLALMVAEQLHSGERANLGLLYITPTQSDEKLWRDSGAMEGGRLPREWLDRFENSKLNQILDRLLNAHRTAFEQAAEKLRIAHITWQNLVERCEAIVARLDAIDLGDETLARLLVGFTTAVREHAGTGLNSVVADS